MESGSLHKYLHTAAALYGGVLAIRWFYGYFNDDSATKKASELTDEKLASERSASSSLTSSPQFTPVIAPVSSRPGAHGLPEQGTHCDGWLPG